MSSSLSDSALEKKFQGVTNTQDSIQTLSLWLLHHKSNHQKIVAHWMKVLQKAKITHRLTLFYLANDVIQNSKRKGFLLFVNSFAEVLKEATLLVRDDQIRPNIQRVFSIWEQRNVYSAEFIADLQAILTNSKVPSTAPSKLLADFKPDMVIKKLRSVLKLEMEASSKQSSINFTKLNATESEIVQQFKDRIHGQQFSRDFDKSIKQLEELVDIKEKEINERNDLILILEQSSIYYDNQKGEAKIVANAYKNFDGRVKSLQKKLADLSSTLPSPLPSPSVDAPSPTTSDLEVELDLPVDNASEKELDDAPSPEGSPEGLNLSPVADKKSPLAATTATLGNPIPTLSNFFTHGTSGMSSLLGAFSNKSEAKGGDSLDTRLSSLLQNIPHLPLFGETAPDEKSSGQNTPLQDEDPFPNKQQLQQPQDILKGLAGLIAPAEDKKPEGGALQPPSFFPTQSSFIPSLVQASAPPRFEEYNPEAELFNTDMELEEEEAEQNSATPPRGGGGEGRRLSTLITVVTEDSRTGAGAQPWPPEEEFLMPPAFFGGPPPPPRWCPPPTRPFLEKRRPFRGNRRPWGTRPPHRYHHNGH